MEQTAWYVLHTDQGGKESKMQIDGCFLRSQGSNVIYEQNVSIYPRVL